mmetsp:Transcript_39371/g.92828  ORF Transcript_39371/g.92828 Transcript_39371/m.92828 type:complete len:239 (-) Transcript_39371:25-741(-)
MTEGVGCARRRGRSSAVSAKGPRWLVAMCSSSPWGVRVSGAPSIPAQCTTPFSDPLDLRTAWAKGLTEERSLKSRGTSIASKLPPGTCCESFWSAASALSAVRHARMTLHEFPPRYAATASPIPLFAPVTSRVGFVPAPPVCAMLVAGSIPRRSEVTAAERTCLRSWMRFSVLQMSPFPDCARSWIKAGVLCEESGPGTLLPLVEAGALLIEPAGNVVPTRNASVHCRDTNNTHTIVW